MENGWFQCLTQSRVHDVGMENTRNQVKNAKRSHRGDAEICRYDLACHQQPNIINLGYVSDSTVKSRRSLPNVDAGSRQSKNPTRNTNTAKQNSRGHSSSPEKQSYLKPIMLDKQVGGFGYSQFLEKHKSSLMDKKSKALTFMGLCSNPAIRIRMVHKTQNLEQKESLHQLMRQLRNTKLGQLRSSATTTPSAPFSSTDLIGSYNNDQSRLAGSDEFRHSSLAEVDKRRSGGERRPSSRGKNKHSPNAEKEREGRDISLPGKHEENGLLPLPTKRNHFKPSGVRNNFLTGHNAQIIGQSPPKPLLPSQPTTAEVDELVAMGTNWNPSPGQRNGRLGNSTHGGSTYTSSKPRNGRLSTGYQFNSGSTTKTNNPKEIEPKYSDPVVGAPPSFQQRLSELGTLEADTIRWERTKKLKKKSKES